VKAVLFPAELKRPFGVVLKPFREGQAVPGCARPVAPRDLRKADRLMKGDLPCMNLHVMRSLQVAQSIGHALVLGTGRYWAA